MVKLLLLIVTLLCSSFLADTSMAINHGGGGDEYDDHSGFKTPERSFDPNVVAQLIGKLFRNYNKEAVLDMPIVIHMDILLLKVKNTIEKEGIFESVIALMIEWHDRRMSWNPAEYGNLTFLSLSTEQVWLPDIAMTNSADHLYSISRDNRFMVRVSYDGLFKFVPTGTARTWCDLKLLTFPFDIQQCSLEFESWSLDSTTMTFDGNSDLLVDSSFASTQFQLCEHRAITYYHTYNFTGETFTRLRFEFTVKRKSTFYVINLIFPCATLSMIQLLTFLIPSTETTADRIGFGTTNLLTLVVFQTIITEEMPKTSDAVTALSKYVISLICLAAVGILESVIVERLLEKTLHPPSFWILQILKPVPVFLRETPSARKKSKSDKANYSEVEFSIHRDESLYCINNPLSSKRSSFDAQIVPEPPPQFQDETRRPSYQKAVANGKLSKSLFFRDSNGNPTIRPSMSMVSFQPSLMSIPDIKIIGDDDDIITAADFASKRPNSLPLKSTLEIVPPEPTIANFDNIDVPPPIIPPPSRSSTNKWRRLSKSWSKLVRGSPARFGLNNNRSDKHFCEHCTQPGSDCPKTLLKTPPVSQTFTSSSPIFCNQQQQQTASDMWAEVAFKLDSLSLLVCGTTAIVCPMAMFLPLVVFGESEGPCMTDYST